MRFYRDAPDVTTEVEWSFVADETPCVPFAHAFYSRTWELSEDDEPPIGEVDGPRRWLGGTPSYALPILGPFQRDDLGLCGSEQQWAEGASIVDPVPPLWPGTGVQRCCKAPPFAMKGGVILGGNPIVSPCCPSAFLPRVIQCTYTVFIVSCIALDGIPFLLHATTEWPADLPQRPTWKSDPIDLGMGSMAVCWIGCISPVLGWFQTWTNVFGVAIASTDGLQTVTCAPFHLSNPSQVWNATVGTCDIFSAGVDVVAV